VNRSSAGKTSGKKHYQEETVEMNKEHIEELKKEMYSYLVNDTLPFWTEHAIDKVDGGYSTFLDRKGALLSTQKPMWVAGRFAWMLARLYNELEPNPEWLELSRHGIEFIEKYGFDHDGRMYYLVEKDGRPIRKRRYTFTETFAVIALAEYARAAGSLSHFQRAQQLMATVLHLYRTEGLLEPKYIEENYAVRGHSMAMIQINTLQVLRSAATALGEVPEVPGFGTIDSLITNAINEVFRYFVKPELKALLETVGTNGEYLGNIPEGRCINPGHPIETAWFIMEEGRWRKDDKLIRKALPLLDWSLDAGWDAKYGGLFYFVDVEGRQPVQLEWDMKLWWPHNEAIYASLLAYHLTGNTHFEQWFFKLYRWSMDHFPDRVHGEWIGYLHRDGTTALDMKGNNFKGPFHLPRQQLYTYLLLKHMQEKGD
jgi:N-acylglucosamine 2-epimerase